MRTIGEGRVFQRYIGQQHVLARYVGEELIFQDYIRRGLLHQFDGRNNTGRGFHDPNAQSWTDLVTGVEATLANVSWQNFGVLFSDETSKVFYQGQNVQRYTIFSTHMVSALEGQHPRLFGEAPYPTLYLRSNRGYAYAFFGQGQDNEFLPETIPPVGTVMQAAVRFGGDGVIDFFYNGVFAGQLENVVLNPGSVSTMYIGCRGADDRAFRGEIYEHLVYDRPLRDEEIYYNFLISKERYPL